MTAVGMLAASLGYAQSPLQAPSSVQTPAANPSAAGAAAVAPNQSLIEAQRRLNSAHRRRAREASENARNAQLLLSSAEITAATPTPRTVHRRANMFRHTTPLGRRAVQPPRPAAM
jgi:hypothetical protein